MRVLLAYDGSPEGHGLLRTIPALLPGSTARVLTVYEGPMKMQLSLASAGGVGYVGLDDDAWAQFEQTAHADALQTAQEASEALAAGGVSAEGVAEAARVDADTVDRILQMARNWRADLVATGTRGRGGLKRALLGSTSTGLLHRAEMPVLIVPGGASGDDGPVLVAYDGSPAAVAAVELAARISGRELVVVNVQEAPDQTVGLMAAVDAPLDMTPKLEGWLADQAMSCAVEGAKIATDAGASARAHAELVAGSLHQGVLDIAAREHAAVVVTGSRGRGGVASALLGSVSSGLVHNGELPTLVVPGPATE
jgi:nucleotide-binding universal stress UspA family protein